MVQAERVGDKIHVQAPKRDKESLREIPGSYWLRSNDLWTLPLTWSSCLALRATFRDRLEVGEELNNWAREHKEKVIGPGMEWRDKFHRDSDEPDLFPHQKVDVAFMSATRRTLLINDPGAGKSLSSIRSLKKLHDDGEQVFPCLVIAPNSVKVAWQREFNRWWPEVDVAVVAGSAAVRRRILEEDHQVYVMNYESLRAHSRLAGYGSIALKRCVACGGEDSRVTPAKCEVHEKELNRIQFSSVIADEIHRVKDPRSMQSRAALGATPPAETTIRFGLTGTPIGNSILDLWSLLHFIDPVEWSTKIKWSDRFCNVIYDSWGGIVACDVKPEMENEFHQTVYPHMRRVPLDAVVQNLPPVIEERRDVEMSAKQQRAYTTMAENLMAMIDGNILMADSPMTGALRLLQLASSYGEIEQATADDGSVRTRLVLSDPSSKLDAFMDLLDDFPDRPMSVFAVSSQLINLLSARLEKKGIRHGVITGSVSELDRQVAIDDFQSGKTRIILLTFGAGGTGITLTAANMMVTLQRPWSSIEWSQAQARQRRIGSEIHDHILRVDLVAPDTIEESVIAALDGKAETLENLVRDRELLAKALRGK